MVKQCLRNSHEATHLSTQQTNRNAKGFPINGTYANAYERTIEVPISMIRYADDATECSSLEYVHKTPMITWDYTYPEYVVGPVACCLSNLMP